MTLTQKQKPTQRMVSVDEIIPDIYGVCPHCGDVCYVKPNRYRNRPEKKYIMQRLGERGQYWVDWHDYVEDGQVRRGQSCYGCNAVPSRLIKVPVHVDHEGNGICVFCDKRKSEWAVGEECSSRKAAAELFEPGTSVEEMAKICHRWVMRTGSEQNRILREVRSDAYATGLDQYLGATPLAELHIPTDKNCGHHFTLEEARRIVGIIRAEIAN